MRPPTILCDVIVSRALELESDSAGEEGAEAPACRSVKRDVQRVIRQPS